LFVLFAQFKLDVKHFLADELWVKAVDGCIVIEAKHDEVNKIDTWTQLVYLATQLVYLFVTGKNGVAFNS
jgi:hypothetical protein